MNDVKTTPDAVELLSEHASFGGVQRFYRHASREIGLPMRFALYLPPNALASAPHSASGAAPSAAATPVPLLVFLAGLTCTEETFTMKAGAQRLAAELGLALLMPDTSPRGTGVPGEADAWDFGVGAGFYLDATQAPWAAHWRMESYLLRELLPLVHGSQPVDAQCTGVFGHSMGGHGALTLALRHPGVFRSVSAIAPIAAPTRCPWGHKAFGSYLGDDRAEWLQHDASALMQARADAKRPALYPQGILVDQGLADKFLPEQLYPEAFEQACAAAGQPLTLRRHVGYDHGYYFIATVVDDHLRHHAGQLST
jgi:S-formylglutathione hydrolase